MINYGVVYPQAILIFVITTLYSVVYPLIVIFGAIYFGMAYVVYKYKLLFGQFIVSFPFHHIHRFFKSFTSHTNPRVRLGPSHSFA
jgi:Calcium-dependent channel, 7TM region, putative phosphate